MQQVRFPGSGGDEIAGELFEASGERADDGRAIVLVHEVFGVDAHLREIAERFAAAGFFVLVPDLYSRTGLPGPASTDDDPAPEWDVELIRSTVAGLPDRVALADLDGAAAFLAAFPGVDRRGIAIVGFCMGGTLAFLSGCTSTRFAAVVEFYGKPLYAELSAAKPIQPLEMLLNLDRPLLAFFGGRDASIPMEHVEMLRTMLGDANKAFEVVVYPEAEHSFFNHRRARFHEPSARDAWERTLAFLDETL